VCFGDVESEGGECLCFVTFLSHSLPFIQCGLFFVLCSLFFSCYMRISLRCESFLGLLHSLFAFSFLSYLPIWFFGLVTPCICINARFFSLRKIWTLREFVNEASDSVI